MTSLDLLTELDRLNVKVSLAGDKLRIEAPAGALTPGLKKLIIERKAELVKLLSGNKQQTVSIWPGIIVRIYQRPKECVEAGQCVYFPCDYYPFKPGWCRQRVSMR